MWDYIKGVLVEVGSNKAIVETGGIGYRLFIPSNAASLVERIGLSVWFYVSPIIREDGHFLYGFLSKQERDLFEVLLTVSGIGPKTALSLIGHMDLSLFQRAIFQKDSLAIAKVPGIGKKTAERLVMEMKDKIALFSGGKEEESLSELPKDSKVADAMSALVHLGYSSAQAKKAIQLVLEGNKETPLDAGNLVSAALRLH